MTSRTDEEIEIPGRPPVEGLRFRHFRGDEDFPGLVRVNNAARLAYGVEELVDIARMRHDYANLTNSDLHDDLLVVEVNGEIAGYSRVSVTDQTDGSITVDAVGLLQPDLRGRRIGSAMMDWIDGRARIRAASMPADRERWLMAFNWDADAFAARLFERRGFQPVRHFYELVRPNLEDLPDAPVPDGLEVRPVSGDDLRRIWEAHIEIFRDDWGEDDESEAAYRRFSGDPRLDPSLFVIAFDGDEIAGVVHNLVDDASNETYGRRYGILASVGTRREYRRRGLARALICRSLRLLRERGLDGAMLSVDADNPNRALGLYESCGFLVRSSATEWRRRLDDLMEVSR